MLTFQCFLDCAGLLQSQAAKSGELPDELDEYESKVMAACEILDYSGVKFRMFGFGLDWVLDVEYDCSIFMESLPGILGALAKNEEFEFIFASQGVERILTFIPDGERVRIVCSLLTGMDSNPPFEDMAKVDLVEMLERLAVDFGVALMRTSSPLSAEEPFRSWAEGRVRPTVD